MGNWLNDSLGVVQNFAQEQWGAAQNAAQELWKSLPAVEEASSSGSNYSEESGDVYEAPPPSDYTSTSYAAAESSVNAVAGFLEKIIIPAPAPNLSTNLPFTTNWAVRRWEEEAEQISHRWQDATTQVQKTLNTWAQGIVPSPAAVAQPAAPVQEVVKTVQQGWTLTQRSFGDVVNSVEQSFKKNPLVQHITDALVPAGPLVFNGETVQPTTIAFVSDVGAVVKNTGNAMQVQLKSAESVNGTRVWFVETATRQKVQLQADNVEEATALARQYVQDLAPTQEIKLAELPRQNIADPLGLSARVTQGATGLLQLKSNAEVQTTQASQAWVNSLTPFFGEDPRRIQARMTRKITKEIGWISQLRTIRLEGAVPTLMDRATTWNDDGQRIYDNAISDIDRIYTLLGKGQIDEKQANTQIQNIVRKVESIHGGEIRASTQQTKFVADATTVTDEVSNFAVVALAMKLKPGLSFKEATALVATYRSFKGSLSAAINGSNPELAQYAKITSQGVIEGAVRSVGNGVFVKVPVIGAYITQTISSPVTTVLTRFGAQALAPVISQAMGTGGAMVAQNTVSQAGNIGGTVALGQLSKHELLEHQKAFEAAYRAKKAELENRANAVANRAEQLQVVELKYKIGLQDYEQAHQDLQKNVNQSIAHQATGIVTTAPGTFLQGAFLSVLAPDRLATGLAPELKLPVMAGVNGTISAANLAITNAVAGKNTSFDQLVLSAYHGAMNSAVQAAGTWNAPQVSAPSLANSTAGLGRSTQGATTQKGNNWLPTALAGWLQLTNLIPSSAFAGNATQANPNALAPMPALLNGNAASNAPQTTGTGNQSSGSGGNSGANSLPFTFTAKSAPDLKPTPAPVVAAQTGTGTASSANNTINTANAAVGAAPPSPPTPAVVASSNPSTPAVVNNDVPVASRSWLAGTLDSVKSFVAGNIASGILSDAVRSTNTPAPSNLVGGARTFDGLVRWLSPSAAASNSSGNLSGNTARSSPAIPAGVTQVSRVFQSLLSANPTTSGSAPATAAVSKPESQVTVPAPPVKIEKQLLLAESKLPDGVFASIPMPNKAGSVHIRFAKPSEPTKAGELPKPEEPQVIGLKFHPDGSTAATLQYRSGERVGVITDPVAKGNFYIPSPLQTSAGVAVEISNNQASVAFQGVQKAPIQTDQNLLNRLGEKLQKWFGMDVQAGLDAKFSLDIEQQLPIAVAQQIRGLGVDKVELKTRALENRSAASVGLQTIAAFSGNFSKVIRQDWTLVNLESLRFQAAQAFKSFGLLRSALPAIVGSSSALEQKAVLLQNHLIDAVNGKASPIVVSGQTGSAKGSGDILTIGLQILGLNVKPVSSKDVSANTDVLGRQLQVGQTYYQLAADFRMSSPGKTGLLNIPWLVGIAPRQRVTQGVTFEKGSLLTADLVSIINQTLRTLNPVISSPVMRADLITQGSSPSNQHVLDAIQKGTLPPLSVSKVDTRWTGPVMGDANIGTDPLNRRGGLSQEAQKISYFFRVGSVDKAIDRLNPARPQALKTGENLFDLVYPNLAKNAGDRRTILNLTALAIRIPVVAKIFPTITLQKPVQPLTLAQPSFLQRTLPRLFPSNRRDPGLAGEIDALLSNRLKTAAYVGTEKAVNTLVEKIQRAVQSGQNPSLQTALEKFKRDHLREFKDEQMVSAAAKESLQNVLDLWRTSSQPATPGFVLLPNLTVPATGAVVRGPGAASGNGATATPAPSSPPAPNINLVPAGGTGAVVPWPGIGGVASPKPLAPVERD